MYALISNNVLFSCFSNVLECCTCSRMKFTARMVWRYCAVAHLRGNQDYLYLNFGCVHPFPCFFCFTWEFGNILPKDNCPRNSSNCFRKSKSPNFTVKLAINFSINLVSYHWYHFCFYLAPKISQKKKTAFNVMFEIFNIFWNARSK